VSASGVDGEAKGSERLGAAATESDSDRDAHSLEERILQLFAPDAEIAIGFPLRIYRGKDEIAAVVRQVLAADAARSPIVQGNQDGRIRSLTLLAPDFVPPAPVPPPSPSTPSGTSWNGRFAGFGSALGKLAPTILTLATLIFLFFPELKRLTPPEVRGVSLSDVALGAQRPGAVQGSITNEVLFTVEAVGYEADEEIGAAWERFDARSLESLDDGKPTGWGHRFNFETRNDRAVGRLYVPPPVTLPSTRCVFVRVSVFLAPVGNDVATPGPDWLLDYADTRPFDPYDGDNPDCPHATAEASSARGEL
jgi:hypothetical protein